MKQATLYRMDMPDHRCPFGIKSKRLLEREGFDVVDHRLTDREAVDDFLQREDVKTTPQTYIDGNRIGGFESLLDFFNKPSLKQEGLSYQPVIAIFAMGLLMSVAGLIGASEPAGFVRLIELFVAFSMCLLALMKLRDLFSFSNQFVTYDLLAARYPPYAYFYPFIEASGGLLMIAGVLTTFAAPFVFVVAGINAVSVVKAVYIDRRALRCACVGGDSTVPLGFVSLTENLVMVLAAVWMWMS